MSLAERLAAHAEAVNWIFVLADVRSNRAVTRGVERITYPGGPIANYPQIGRWRNPSIHLVPSLASLQAVLMTLGFDEADYSAALDGVLAAKHGRFDSPGRGVIRLATKAARLAEFDVDPTQYAQATLLTALALDHLPRAPHASRSWANEVATRLIANSDDNARQAVVEDVLSSPWRRQR